jgi:hypothetical protein
MEKACCPKWVVSDMEVDMDALVCAKVIVPKEQQRAEIDRPRERLFLRD